MAQLQNWVSQAKAHWAEFQPTKFAELKKAGTLENALQDAALRTAEEMNDLEEAGLQEHEAWEMTREKYLFPPEEQSLQDSETNPAATRMQDVMRIVNSQYEDSDQPQEQ